MHEIGTDGSAVDAAGFLGGFSGERIQFGLLQRFEQAKGIERGFQIAPAAESVEDAFALFVTDAFRDAACRGFLGGLRKFCGALFFQSCTMCHKSSSMNLLFCHRTREDALSRRHLLYSRQTGTKA